MIRLFSTSYPCANPHRRDELAAALSHNLQCSALTKICLLREGQDDLPIHDKLEVRDVESRPTFNDFFAWISEIQGPNDIAIIANSDIWFDQTIALTEQFLEADECWAMARWDCRESGPILNDRNDSQDAWALRGNLKSVQGNFHLGTPRCDNRLLYELQSAGYRTLNPAFSIVCHHQHDEEPRNYSLGDQHGFADPPYRYLWPHNLLPVWQTSWHNLRSPIKVRWQIDPRRIQRSLPVRAWRRLTKAK